MKLNNEMKIIYTKHKVPVFALVKDGKVYNQHGRELHSSLFNKKDLK